MAGSPENYLCLRDQNALTERSLLIMTQVLQVLLSAESKQARASSSGGVFVFRVNLARPVLANSHSGRNSGNSALFPFPAMFLPAILR